MDEFNDYLFYISFFYDDNDDDDDHKNTYNNRMINVITRMLISLVQTRNGIT